MARTNHCSLFAILLKSMAAFFRCFGISYADRDRRHLKLPLSDSPISTPAEPVLSTNRELSFSFSPEGREDGVDIDVRLGFDDSELKDEAKFLKACGTLQETPEEIKKLSKKLNDSAVKDSEPKYHSWLPISTTELLENDELSGQLSAVRFDEEITTEPAEMDIPTPCSRTINEHSEVHISISSLEDAVADNTITKVKGTPEAANISISPGPVACKSEFLNRSVRFASQSFPTESSPRTCIQNREKPELKDHGSLIRHSPYPTPLNLTDDMQTPGTVFASGNNARVRSQYVYTSMNASEIIDHSSISQGLPLGPPQNANRNSEMSLIGSSIRGELTLSPWLRTAALDGTGNERKINPGGNQWDRPIIGLVADHWKEEEDVSHISLKEWDGNGIPNTTTKYKEDQKVRWHATPFVERLEKALSEESFIPQRKRVISEAVVFEDEEERDTVSCKLQSVLEPSKPLDSY